MVITRDLKSVFRGNWSGKMARFQDFQDLLVETAQLQPPVIKHDKSVRRHQRKVYKASGRQYYGIGGKIDVLLAKSVNSRGEIQVGEKIFRISRPDDLAAIVTGLQSGYEEQRKAEGLVQEIICHQYQSTAPVCVSINTNTYLPSFASAHVENFIDSTYITTYFDTYANGRLTRVQLWKGHLALPNMTGAEISIWHPDTREVLKCTSPFNCQWVKEEYFGPIWFPYVHNQVSISWDLVAKSTGQVFLGFGADSLYEKEAKWWAGKWIDQAAAATASKKGEDYTIRYVIRDATGIIANGQGAW